MNLHHVILQQSRIRRRLLVSLLYSFESFLSALLHLMDQLILDPFQLVLLTLLDERQRTLDLCLPR